MAMGRRKDRAQTPGLWIAANELPPTGGHPFYQRLNQVLDAHAFDDFVEAQCAPFYAAIGRPSLTPGTYFRLLLIGYFEGIDSERGIAWRTADSLALRGFLAWAWTRSRRSTRRSRGPDASSIWRRTARSLRGSCRSWRRRISLKDEEQEERNICWQKLKCGVFGYHFYAIQSHFPAPLSDHNRVWPGCLPNSRSTLGQHFRRSSSVFGVKRGFVIRKVSSSDA